MTTLTLFTVYVFGFGTCAAASVVWFAAWKRRHRQAQQ